MNYYAFVKRYVTASVLFSCSSVIADNTSLGIVGGTNGNNGYVALIGSTGEATQVTLPGLVGISQILADGSYGPGQAIVGGVVNSTTAYAALIGLTGAATQVMLPNLSGTSEIRSVAINFYNQAVVGGNSNGTAYVAQIAPGGGASQVMLPGLTGGGQINSVAINTSSQAIVGGANNGNAYVALIVPGVGPSEVSLPGLTGSNKINSVAINDANKAIVGGANNGNAYVALIVPGVGPSEVTLPGLVANSKINSVDINASGQAIVGGDNHNLTAAYVVLIAPGGAISELTLPGVVGNSQINSVAINNFGQAIVGGGNSNNLEGYVVLIAPNGTSTQVTLPGVVGHGNISSVAINYFGQAIVGGTDNNLNTAYAALIAPDGTAIQINLPGLVGSTNIAFVSMLLLSQIPTSGLSGNNLKFANYINQYAPINVFYFIPSILDGTLNRALESAAPTRNAFALYTADNNLFYLDTLLSTHSHNARQYRRQIAARSAQPLALNEIEADQLLVANKSVQQQKPKEKSFQIWGNILGAVAYQKAEHQAPAFQPTTGGAIIGFDGKVTSQSWFGAGAAYTYTHIHEKEGAGHSHTNQEYLFLYSMWDNSRLYCDAALWGGLFQIDNVRKIKMTSFEFQSTSHPKGWQLSPHFELGYDFNSQNNLFTAEPFVMLDWVSNWQNSYKEKGDGPFNATQKNHYSSFLRSELGARFYETIRFDNWSLVVQEKASFVNKKPFKVGRVNAFLVGAPGSFTVETLTTTQNLGVAEVELLFQPKDPAYPSGSLSYQGEFGSMYQSHLVSVDVTWNF